MSIIYRFEGGPCQGETSFSAPLGQSIAFALDELLRPVQGVVPFALAVYQLHERPDGVIYVFKGLSRPDNQPFPITFVGGPGAGTQPSLHPAQFLDPVQRIPLSSDGSRLVRDERPAAVAVYERRELDGRCFFEFQSTDSSPEAIQALVELMNDEKLTQAVNMFYAEPDYDTYSIKPTGEHVQVPVELGHRRGYVDELMAPIILGIWKLGLDTLGSCQSRPKGTNNEGMAYVGFPRLRDAKSFYDRLTRAGIPCRFDEKKLTIGRKQSKDASPSEVIEIDSGNVLFEVQYLEKIAELMSLV